jgi:hypothetical protein
VRSRPAASALLIDRLADRLLEPVGLGHVIATFARLEDLLLLDHHRLLEGVRLRSVPQVPRSTGLSGLAVRILALLQSVRLGDGVVLGHPGTLSAGRLPGAPRCDREVP